MDEVSLVLGALAAGASAGVSHAATDAVKDAYAALKSGLVDRFRGEHPAELALAQYDEAPEVWQGPVSHYVEQLRVDDDLRQLAQDVLDAAREPTSTDNRVFNATGSASVAATNVYGPVATGGSIAAGRDVVGGAMTSDPRSA